MNKIKECVKRENLSHGFIWRLANYKVLLILIASSLVWSVYKAKEDGILLESFDIICAVFILAFGYVLNLFPAVLCRLLLRKRIRYSVNFSCSIAIVGCVIEVFYHAMVGISSIFPIFLVSVCSYKILRSRCGVASIGFYCRRKTKMVNILAYKAKVDTKEAIIVNHDLDCRIPIVNNDLHIKSITHYKKYKKHFHFLPVLNFILIIFFSVAFYIDYEYKFIKTINKIENTKNESMKYANKENEKIRSELSNIKLELNNFILESEILATETRDKMDELTKGLNEFEEEMDSNISPQEKEIITRMREFKKRFGEIGGKVSSDNSYPKEIKMSGFNETDKERIVKFLSEYIKVEEMGDLSALRKLYFDEVDYYINDYAITTREGAVEESQRNWEKWTTRSYKISSWSGSKIGEDSYIIDLELNYTFSNKREKEEGKKNIVLILDYINKELGISAFREIPAPEA